MAQSQSSAFALDEGLIPYDTGARSSRASELSGNGNDGQFASQSQQSQVLFDMSFQDFGPTRTYTGTMGNEPYIAPVHHWIKDSNGPWNHVLTTGGGTGGDPAANLPGAGGLSGRPGTQRSFITGQPGLSSAFSDSGYESHVRQSIGARSIIGDSDARSIVAPLSTLQYPGMSESIQDSRAGAFQQPAYNQSQSVQSVGFTTGAPGGQLACRNCELTFRTKSELKKHHQRHVKPHRCTVQDCTRKDGFSTRNDLDRHKKSVHRMYSLEGGGDSYRCVEGDCKGKDKIWPRADNFRSHLERAHHRKLDGDDDLQPYVYRPPPSPLLAGLEPPLMPDTQLQDTLLSSSTHPRTWQEPAAELQGDDEPAGAGEPVQPLTPVALTSRAIPFPHEEEFQLTGHDLAEIRKSAVADQDLLIQPGEPLDFLDDDLPTGQTYVVPQALNNRTLDARLFRGNSPEVARREENSDGASGHPSTDQQQDNDIHSPVTVDEAPKDKDDKSRDERMASSVDGAESVNDQPTSAEEPDSRPGSQVSDTAETSRRSSPEESGSVDMPTDASLSEDESKASAVLESLREAGRLERLLEKLGYIKAKHAAGGVKKSQPKASTRSGGQVTCPDCSKTFNRKCELKKHQKRHDKPYGCTYPECRKRFGSKNDWKRHENSQHAQQEMWKCSEKAKANSEAECGRVLLRRETFRTHLQKDHGIEDIKTIEAKCESCRIGRNAESRFWCGFCVRIIEIKQEGPAAWAEKFNHIDNHYTGRTLPKRGIEEWMSFEETQVRPDSRPGSESIEAAPDQQPTAAKKRKSWSEQSCHDGSKRRKPGSSPSDAESRAPSKLVWYCCSCTNMSSVGTTNICMETGCNSHARCGNCKVEHMTIVT